jgi:hypothetical protein
MVFDEQESDLSKYLAEKEFESLKSAVEKRYGALQEKERQALAIVRRINQLIKQQKGGSAMTEFTSNQPLLKKYLDANLFSDIEQRTSASNAEFDKNRKRYLTAGESMKAMAASGKVDEAFAQWRSIRSEMKKYLTAVEYAQCENAVVKPYEILLQHRREARSETAKVSKMIRNDPVGARTHFYKIRSRVKPYLEPGEYEKLDSTVSAAYVEFNANTKKAYSLSEKIYGKMKVRNIDEAHSMLKSNNSILKKYVDANAYRKLESTVTSSFNELESERKAARTIERQIYGFINKDQLWQAYKTFQSKRSWLRRYLEPGDYKKLEHKVTSSYNSAKKK